MKKSKTKLIVKYISLSFGLVITSFVLPTFMIVIMDVFTLKEVIEELSEGAYYKGVLNSIPFILFSIYLLLRDHRLSMFEYGDSLRTVFYGYALFFFLLSLLVTYDYNNGLGGSGASLSGIVFIMYAMFSVVVFAFLWLITIKKKKVDNTN